MLNVIFFVSITRMKKRDAGSAPKLGDRVPYVIVAGVKGSKAYEKAEVNNFIIKCLFAVCFIVVL